MDIVAAICWGLLGKPVTVEEIQVDPPKANEVRVKMLCASFCHTDRTLKGSVFGGIKTVSDLSNIANKCQKEEFPLQELFTHEVSLADVDRAFELAKQPDCVKVVIKI